MHPSSDISEAALTISDLCSRTGVELSLATEMPSYSTENSTEIASTQRQQYSQISSGTVEGANSSASGLPPKSCASQQSYPGNISISWKEKTCTWKWIFEQENHTVGQKKKN